MKAGRAEASFGIIWSWPNIGQGAHTKHRLQVHLMWIPKYRRRVLRGKIAVRLRQLLREACKMNGWQISEISIETDHIHLIMQVKPRDSASGVVQILKGGTSRVLRKEYPELEESLRGDSFWADGYFAESVGHVDKDVVKRYIQEQRERS